MALEHLTERSSNKYGRALLLACHDRLRRWRLIFTRGAALQADEQLAFVGASVWTFAKTMPTIPHYWTIIEKSHDPAAFTAFVDHIDRHGTSRRWFDTVRNYVDLGEWRYWCMRKRPATLINRQLIAISKCSPPLV